MIRKEYKTPVGMIRYWTNSILPGRQSLIFLPGLSADHHLFDRQIGAFENDFNIVAWDAPGQGESRPFEQGFSLMDKAVWLHGILEAEKISRPILIGQSFGGYVAQCCMEKYPTDASGFISIDSAPLNRRYVTAAEIFLLKRAGFLYRMLPWAAIRKTGSCGCAVTEYGRSLMLGFIDSYTKDEYCVLSECGYRMMAEAMEADLKYAIPCPAVLICGERDRAGSSIRYSRRWAHNEGFPLHMIADAGHNSNTDAPDEVNRIILEFIRSPKEAQI